MTTVSMLESRQNAEGIIRRVRQRERMVLTYRRKPVIRLVPVGYPQPYADDPFYRLDRLADAKGQSLTNREIDRIIYGR